MTDVEERLKVFRLLSQNPHWLEPLAEAVKLQKRRSKECAEQGYNYLGFEWYKVHCPPAILQHMVTERILDITHKSSAGTLYRLRDLQLIEEAVKAIVV